MNIKTFIQLQKILFKLCYSLLFISMTAVAADSLSDDQDILEILKKNNVQGTMIIASENNQVTYVYNTKRANLRISPASTFKIANSIVAIEKGTLKDQYEIIKWDGKKRFLNAWNQDHNLKTAFRTSCVWCYQKLAKKIGKKHYLKYLAHLNYGNHFVGQDVTNFWLKEEKLQITPLEQINFLQRIYHKKLPISAKTYDILQDIMLEEATANYKIYSKTGAATKDWIGHGWYVGYITSKERSWFFATNILINGMKDLPKRRAVTIAALKKKGII